MKKIKELLSKAKELSVKYMDKITHFIAGYFIADFSAYFVSELKTFLIVLAIGIFKEAYDYKYGDTGFNRNDLIATVLGYFTWLAFHLLFS